MVALPGAAEIAERARQENQKKGLQPTSPGLSADPIDQPLRFEAMSSAPEEKERSINFAKEKFGKEHPGVEHLSAPASAVHSGTGTPEPERATEAETEVVPLAERQHRGSEIVEGAAGGD